MEQGKKQKIIRSLCIIGGILLITDTILVRTTSNWGLGVVLPALLGTPLLCYGLFQAKINRWFCTRPGKFVKWLLIAGYCFLITVFLVGGIAMASAAKTAPAPGADAIIVLGAGIRGDEASYTLQNRLDAAADYYAQNPEAVIVVSGGMGAGEQYSEAYVMEKYLTEQRHIPPGAVIQEARATSTQENFLYAKEILDELFGRSYRVVFVTNDFHILRASMLAQEAGMDAQGLAAPTPAFVAPNNYARESLALLEHVVFG